MQGKTIDQLWVRCVSLDYEGNIAHQIALRILVLFCGISLFGCGKGFGGKPPAVVVDLRKKGNIVDYQDAHDFLYVRKAKDLTPLSTGDATAIRGIKITDSQFSDISALTCLPHLEELLLRNTAVINLSPLSKFDNLRMLDLSETAVVDLSPLRSVSSLEDLSLNQTKVDDLSPLAALTKLRTLSLAKSQVGDLSPLAKLKSLETLYLLKGTATPKEVAMLRNALPNCRIVSD